MHKTLAVLLLLHLFPAAPAGDEDATVKEVQKRYEQTKTIKAKFVQKAYLKTVDEVQTTSGDVYIKKPGRMKWVYSAPEPQILVSNNKLLWLYVPDDKQVTKMPVENVYSNNTPALFLAGKGKLTESFTVEQVVTGDDAITIVMVPRQKDINMDRLVLSADKKNYQIVGSTVYDKLGNKTEIAFADIETNPDLPDDMFQFKAPEGVDVLDFSQKP